MKKQLAAETAGNLRWERKGKSNGGKKNVYGLPKHHSLILWTMATPKGREGTKSRNWGRVKEKRMNGHKMEYKWRKRGHFVVENPLSHPCPNHSSIFYYPISTNFQMEIWRNRTNAYCLIEYL
jgi:hypothetical protein